MKPVLPEALEAGFRLEVVGVPENAQNWAKNRVFRAFSYGKCQFLKKTTRLIDLGSQMDKINRLVEVPMYNSAEKFHLRDNNLYHFICGIVFA